MGTKDIMTEFVLDKIDEQEFKRKLEMFLKMDVSTAPTKKWLRQVVNQYFYGAAYLKLINTITRF